MLLVPRDESKQDSPVGAREDQSVQWLVGQVERPADSAVSSSRGACARGRAGSASAADREPMSRCSAGARLQGSLLGDGRQEDSAGIPMQEFCGDA